MPAFYKLTPAYRHGKDTPWGGHALSQLFKKPVPDDRTGEALEASTLPGLESHTADGKTLTEIAGGPLPLLLKFIDAREALSVQVHPDDSYAATHENGKLGKTEAWLILDAQPGAKLVYGLLPGTDVRALTGKAIEDHLRWVEVRAGDVLFIPAGMVHAIGEGIVLYEIQQSSDVTYRFWDWDRRDQQGNPRQLHWEKACDVARADLQLSPTRGEIEAIPGGSITRYLNTPHFTLDKLGSQGKMALPVREGFQFVTALSEGRLLTSGDSEVFYPGDTFYIPPKQDGIFVIGTCELLISAQP